MDKRLTPELERRIRSLCDEIVVAHDLDDDLREELHGHVEDKILGYLNGEVPVSEDDAFILAREHFGDPARLKELLSRVHHLEADTSLSRRVLAIAMVSEGLGIISGMLDSA